MMMWFETGIALVAAGVYYSYRYAWWRPAVSYTFPRILMYHMIKKHQGGKFRGLRVSPEMFEKQVKYLAENGWHFFTMSELITQRESLPPKAIALTFDDGYEDNYTHAFPILQKYGAKATIYLVVERHGREWSSKRKSRNNSGELMHEPKLTDAQIEEMLASGLVEIGSHTMTHDNLSRLDEKGKYHEIADAKRAIEERFGIHCDAFCYPFGIFDEKDAALVEAAGYTNATTTKAGIDDLRSADLYRLRRITISGKDNFLAFWLKLRTGKRGVKK